MSLWLFKQPSTAAKTVLVYITAGAFIVIWTAVWYVYLWNNPPENRLVYYWVTGFMVTGMIMVFIGLVLGRFGRSGWIGDPAQAGTATSLVMPPSSPLVVVNPSPNGTVAAPAPAAANLVAMGGAQDGHVVAPPAL